MAYEYIALVKMVLNIQFEAGFVRKTDNGIMSTFKGLYSAVLN